VVDSLSCLYKQLKDPNTIKSLKNLTHNKQLKDPNTGNSLKTLTHNKQFKEPKTLCVRFFKLFIVLGSLSCLLCGRFFKLFIVF
jgi:ribonuclease HIII